ncbi:DUF3302 domain-containing protein [Pseudomonadota bacterium]
MLEYAALALLITMVTFMIYLVIYIHDIPYEIAKKRNHPHQDAIHIAGWVSLFLAHTIWPILWIWAYLYKPDEKFMQFELTGAGSAEQDKKIAQLETQIQILTEALDKINLNGSQSQAEENSNG